MKHIEDEEVVMMIHTQERQLTNEEFQTINNHQTLSNRAGSPLCDLDEKKFPNPNHLNQLLKMNHLENSVNDTINTNSVSNGAQNAAGTNLLSVDPQAQDSRGFVVPHRQQININENNSADGEGVSVVEQSSTRMEPNNKTQPAAPAQPIFREAKKPRLVQSRRSKQRTRVNLHENQQVVQSKVFQINIQDQINSFQPAVIMRQSISPPSGDHRKGLLSGQGLRQKGRTNTTYFNETLNLQQQQLNPSDNRFSHFGQRKSIRDQVISDFKEVIPHSHHSPTQRGFFSPNQSSGNIQLQSFHDRKYQQRTLMSQRFSNQRLAQNVDLYSSTKPSDNFKEGFLPRLNLKSQGSKRRNIPGLQSDPKMTNEVVFTRTNTNIIIQEMPQSEQASIGFYQKMSRPFTNQNTTRSGLITFEPNNPNRQSSNSSRFGVQKREYQRGPLIDFKEYEVLSDDQCIARNSYNVVPSTHPYHSRKSSVKVAKAVFKVISPRSSRGSKSKPRFADDPNNTEASIKQAEHRQELKRVMSLNGFEIEPPFYNDGVIKTEGNKFDDEKDGFRDFIMIPEYFMKFERLKRRYLNKNLPEKQFFRSIKPDDYLILKQIYPRIFSIKNKLLGKIDEPEVEFNPVEMNQYEIFVVKSVTYLVNHDYEKAEYFIQQGQLAWPNASIEFKFNLGLLHYLKREYTKSIAIYSDLLSQLQDGLDDGDEQTTNLILSLSLNLILSLLKDNHRYQNILVLQKYPSFQKIKMLKNPLNMKIQQLFTYATHQYKLQYKSQVAPIIFTGTDTAVNTPVSQDGGSSSLPTFLKMTSPSLKPLVTLSSSGSSDNYEEGRQLSLPSSSTDEDENINDDTDSNPVRFSQQIISSATGTDKRQEPNRMSMGNKDMKQSGKRKKVASGLVHSTSSQTAINFDNFKKRGNNNFPLKNIKQLEVIKVRKQAEREAKAVANKHRNSNQMFLNSEPISPKERPLSPKEPQFKVKQGQKAKFFNIKNIQDTRSPDYVMSMTEIIGRLQQKDEIMQNKTLLYQLQKLDEVVHQGQVGNTPTEKGAEGADQVNEGPHGNAKKEVPPSLRQTLPFPYQLNENQKKEQLYSCSPAKGGLGSDGETSHSPARDTQIDLCLKGLEELRLEVAMEHGGELERQDPVENQYKIICNSIYALLREENLIQMLEEAKNSMKDRDTRVKFFKKISIAKDILLSALLKRRKPHINMKDQQNDQLVEIELLQEHVRQLKDILMEEATQKEEKKNMKYMEKLEKDIRKMLIIARKKEVERDRVKKQEEEDHMISINPDIIDTTPDSVLIETKSLPSLLKRQKFQEIVAERFNVQKKKFLESVQGPNLQTGEPTLKKSESQSLTQQVLKKFKPVDPDQYTLMLERTQIFLKYVFETFGSYFIAQKTYCMTEFFDLAPVHIMQYFDNTASILSSMPFRIPSLATAFTDNEWIDINRSEFIYNRSDIMQKVISECLRQPKNLEVLGSSLPQTDENAPHDWIIEVTQKFNMISVLNFVMREGIKVFCEQEAHENSEYDQDPDRLLIKQDSTMNHQPIDAFVDQDSLNAIKDQFARLKYQGAFNTALIDMLIGKEVPMFRQFNKETREKIYRLSHLRTIPIDSDTDSESYLDIEKLSKDTVIVILKGNIFYQQKIEEPQKSILVEKVDKQKRRIQVMMPAGPPIVKWVTKQVIGPGMAIPVQFLYWMKEKQSNFRLQFDKSQRSNGQQLTLEYLEFENKDLSDLIFQPIYHSIVKKVSLIQNVDLFNGDSHFGASKLDKLSPYIMFVMASMFKVQVFKMSELITIQDEIPKCMFVILEGQAKAVYEDKLERKGEVCPYSRRSIRTDLPKDLKFGMLNRSSQSPKKSQSPTKNQGILNKESSSSHFNLNEFNIFQVSPVKKSGANELQDSPSKFTSAKPQTITFQNMVFNQEWQEHKPTKKITFNHQIEFGFLTEGQYIGSRVVLEEGALRNFIKTSRTQINKWLQPPQQKQRQTLTQRIKSGFIKTEEQHPSIDENAKKDQDSSDDNDPAANSQFSEDELLHQFDVDSHPSPQVHKKSFKHQLSFGNSPEKEEERELLNMKNFLLRSQLSVVVISSSLQAMVMYRQDKAYFHESVKKMLTEMIQEKNFNDLDRPIEKNKQIDFIRTTQKQWEAYKYKYEEHSLRETFHQKYEQFPR